MSNKVSKASSESRDSHDDPLGVGSQGFDTEHFTAKGDGEGDSRDQDKAVATGTPGQPEATDGQGSAESEYKGHSAEGSTERQVKELAIRFDRLEVILTESRSMLADILSLIQNKGHSSSPGTSTYGKPHKRRGHVCSKKEKNICRYARW